MREHPIPQDITGYRFHIVGSMTLKQFGELALGAIIALIIYSSNLFAIIKWPLMFVAFGGGALAAFVPIAERPVDHWIITFFKVLYRPTQYYWKKTVKIPEVFLFTPGKISSPAEEEVDLTPIRRQRIKEYLISTQLQSSDIDLMPEEKQQIQDITNLFMTTKVKIEKKPTTRPNVTQKPLLTMRMRGLKRTPEFKQVFNIFSQEKTQSPQAEVASTTESLTKSTGVSNQKGEFLATDEVAQNISIPETAAISIDKTSDKESPLEEVKNTAKKQVFIANQAEQQLGVSTANSAVFNAELPFPDKPTTPNKIVGMVLSAQNELISDAIVEIRKANGSIERAVKSNALGQFFITTPLSNGEYIIAAEKDQLQFPNQSIVLSGNQVDPIEIRSTS